MNPIHLFVVTTAMFDVVLILMAIKIICQSYQLEKKSERERSLDDLEWQNRKLRETVEGQSKLYIRTSNELSAITDERDTYKSYYELLK